MSVSTLLESLQSRIHAQASILPGLYSQLGLPSSALTDELNELQSKLTQCVDEVIVKRRQAVEDWENRCQETESGIHKLMLSLGQNGIPAQEAGAANVTVLPEKFGALDAYHDKLRITFTSKLEQLNSLRGRLVNYTRILGEDFVCYRENEETLSEQAVPDVSPDAFSKLEKDMIRSRNEISRRLSSLADSFEHLLWFYEELGKPLPSPDPFLKEGSSSNESDAYFFRIFSSYVTSPTPFLDGVQPTNSLLTWAEEHTNELESVKARRESQIQTMYDELETLWKRLGVDAEEIDQFVDSWTGSTDAVVEAVSNG
jgi:protein regulator of cytokinesis 1